jgi:hypothetical protein
MGLVAALSGLFGAVGSAQRSTTIHLFKSTDTQ